MADYRAIEAISKAVVHLLRLSYQPADFNEHHLQFAVYAAQDFEQPMSAGVSLFLYRVLINGTHRIPSGRRAPGGGRYQTQLPLDLHYLVTVWAKDASLQHRVAGWMMRTLEDTPILPHGLLETVAPGVFHNDEAVELTTGELSNEDLLRIWETLEQNKYQISIPYVARNVRIESAQTISTGPPLEERTFRWQTSAEEPA